MVHEKNYFVKDNGVKLPIGDKYLIPFLSPTSNGTHFRESPPENDISDRQNGRVLLQIHQILHLFQEYGVELTGKTLLDIGTGNGLVPCMILELSELESAVGADPYLDGEHMTSWQVHDHNKALLELKTFLERYCGHYIDYNTYKHLLEYENYSMIPGKIPYKKQPSKQYKFEKVGAHELEKVGHKFDILYCKAIEHIQKWDDVFRSAASVANEHAIFYIKHRSFFSYLGAHRYSSISIPWGHALLTGGEYERYLNNYFPDESQKIKNFYYNGLTYPRVTVSEMIRIARNHNFLPVVIITEPTRYIETVAKFIDDIDGFWEIIGENYPGLGAEEILSGMYHILFRKAE